MKIAFVGDSFCQDVAVEHCVYPYPYLIAEQYNADIVQQGRGGCCLFHSYEDLLNIVDEADYIIFCITQPERLANKHRFGLNNSSVEHYTTRGPVWPYGSDDDYADELLDNIYNTAKNYYEFLYDFNFQQYVHNCILRDIDQLMIEKKKKCIWFPCFENSMQEYVPKSGPIADTELIKISNAELKKLYRLQRAAFDTTDHKNHMNVRNNRNMAKMIINIIETDNFSPYEIKMEDYFEVLK